MTIVDLLRVRIAENPSPENIKRVRRQLRSARQEARALADSTLEFERELAQIQRERKEQER